MPKFKVELDNGRVYEVDADDEGSAQAAAISADRDEPEVGQKVTSRKIGVGQSIKDSLLETLATIAGSPADFVEFAANLGLQATGQPKIGEKGSAFGKPVLGSESIKGKMADVGLTSGAKYDERTRGGQIAKVGTDIAAMATPFTAATMLKASKIPLAARAALSEASLPSAGLNIPKAGYQGIAESILNTAARKPGAFLASEAAGAVGASQGAMIAEGIDPGDAGSVALGSMAGSMGSPAVLAPKAMKNVLDQASVMASGLFGAGKERRAANIIADVISKTGENPETLARALRSTETAKFTSAAKVASPALSKLERFVETASPGFANDKMQINEGAFKVMDDATKKLAATGEPALLRAAAEIEKDRFDTLIEATIAGARNEAIASGSAINPGAAVESGASVTAKNALLNAKDKIKAVEHDLWEKVPLDVRVKPDSLRTAYASVRDDMLDEDRIFYEPTIKRMTEPQTTPDGMTFYPRVPAKDMKRLRSKLMTRAQELYAAGNNLDGALVARLADGARDTMIGLPGFNEARAFSRSFHERWTETFAGRAVATTKNGDLIQEEEVLKKAFAGGGVTGSTRFQQLTDATAMPHPETGTPITPESTASLLGSEELFMRITASKLLDDNGIVNPTRLTNFLKQNQEVLNRFPRLKAQLSSAKKAAETLGTIESASAKSIKEFNASSIGRFLDYEEPTAAITKMMTSPSWTEDLQRLAVAARGDAAAMDGLRTAVHNSVSAKAKDFTTLSNSYLTAPKGKKTLMQQLVDTGVYDRETADRLTGLLNRASKVEGNIQTTAAMKGEPLAPAENQAFDTLVRILGAGAGAKAGQLTGLATSGSSIVMAGAGSRFLRNVLEKVPWANTMTVFEAAAKNPEIMASLIERGATSRPKQAEFIANQLRSSLIAAGVIGLESD